VSSFLTAHQHIEGHFSAIANIAFCSVVKMNSDNSSMEVDDSHFGEGLDMSSSFQSQSTGDQQIKYT